MKVTVCDFSALEADFMSNWESLKNYTAQQLPDLILLPEMPFCNWVAASNEVDKLIKEESVKKHELWLQKIDELDARYVVYSTPVLKESKYYNTAFIYEKGKGHQAIHTKYFFPEEEHFWEDSWYDRTEKAFEMLEIDGLKIGVLLCTEMWFTEQARVYGKQDVDLLLCPRATGDESVEQWLRLGQTLAVISGAYCLSANKTGYDAANDFQWGGTGWVAAPGNGELLGTTNDTGFFTVDIDLNRSKESKLDYPLNVND